MTNPFHNPLYVEAQKQYTISRAGQIAKGFKEYGVSYNPISFTPEEQMEHFMSEVPDIVHYGYGMYVTLKEYQKVIDRLQERHDELETKVSELEGFLEEAERDATYWRRRYDILQQNIKRESI